LLEWLILPNAGQDGRDSLGRGLDPGDQLRLHLGDLSARASQISVYPARPRRRLCDAHFLWSVAYLDPDHDRPVAAGRKVRRNTGALRPDSREDRARLWAHAQLLCGAAPSLADPPADLPVAAAAILALGTVMFIFVGRDFFPAIDGGQIQLHVRAPAGTRIEKTEQIFQRIEDRICDIIPEREGGLIVDNIGLPARFYNLAFTDGRLRARDVSGIA
jgi:hypothetical protein